jgi:cell division cycle 2-like protein
VVYKAKDRKTGDVVALKQVKLLTVKEASSRIDAPSNPAPHPDQTPDPDASPASPDTSPIQGFPVTALREINVLLSLSHPNIINVREMVVGNSMDKIFMVMDFMEHDLKGLMNAMKVPFTASEVKRLMLDLTSAIEYCHEHWVLHRDLKTSNLLMNNRGMVQVCDFGLARKYGDPLKPYTNMVVTLWYRPPELLLGGKTYGPALDVWSLGCIFAELVLRQPLLPGRGEFDQIDRIFKLLGTPNESIWPGCQQLPHFKKFSFKNQPFNHLGDKFKTGPSFTAGGSGTGLSAEGVQLMNAMLCLNPERRIAARGALDHPYFKESPAPKAHHLMPTMPTTHAGKGKQAVKSVDAEEEEKRLNFHMAR